MRVLTPEWSASLTGDSTTLCSVIYITWKSGEVFSFTDLDRDITADGIIFSAAYGYTTSNQRSSETLAVDNLEISGFLSSEAITEADLSNGRWDGARIAIGTVDWEHPEQGIHWVRSGWLGEVSTAGGAYTAEFRGITQQLQQSVNRVYSARCDAVLGDARCGADLSGLAYTGAVGTIHSRVAFSDDGRPDDDQPRLEGGKLTFTSGANAGASREVLYTFRTGVTLEYPFVYEFQTGDTYILYPGCNGTKEVCKTTYNNVINFRGFDEIPGVNRQLTGK